MKYIILFSLTLISLKTFSQSVESCSYDKVVSVFGGSPFNFNVEGGIAGDAFGILGGIKMTIKKTAGNEVYPSSESPNVNVYIKGIIKFYGDEDNILRIYGTGYFGTGKIYGLGLKTGIIVSDELMIFTEESYGESKLQINGGISIRL